MLVGKRKAQRGVRRRRFTHAPHCGEAGVWLCDRAVCSPSVADAPTALAAASRPPGTEAPPPNRCASSAISLSIRSCDGRGVRVGVWVRDRVVAVAARGRGRLGCWGARLERRQLLLAGDQVELIHKVHVVLEARVEVRLRTLRVRVRG